MLGGCVVILEDEGPNVEIFEDDSTPCTEKKKKSFFGLI